MVFRQLVWILPAFVMLVKCFEENTTSLEIRAVEGYEAALPCNMSFTANKDDIALVLWFREDSGVPVYSFDARPNKATHFSDDPLISRAHFDLEYNPPVLKIEHVHKEDEGEYECRIDYRRSRTEKWKIILNVTVPPKSVIIMDENGQRLEGLVGPYDEGSPLFLKCEADGGDPPPAITWWQESILLDDEYFFTPLRITRNEYFINVLKREHLWATLTCQATNTNISSPVSSSITLDLNLKPLHVRITTRRQPLSAGRRVMLACQSRGSRPPARMTWWKEEKKIFSASAITTSENITISELSFTPEIDDHGKTLKCRADNPDIINSALEDEWKLDITYLPELTLLKHEDYVEEGNNVHFECIVKANPLVSEINWQFNGKRFVSNFSKGIIINNHTLELQLVKRVMAGRYRCEATNVEGHGISEEVILRINHTPVCKEGQKTIYVVDPNESILVTCDIEATPPNVSYKWFFNNSLEIIEITSFKRNGTYTEVYYQPDTLYSYGVLYCWARNEVGSQREPCAFTILPAGPPEALKNCGVANKSTARIIIKCEPGYNGGLEQTFHLEVFNTALDRLQMNLTEHDQPLFVVNDLPVGTSFILALYSSNCKGRSNSIALTIYTLLSSRKTAERNHGPIISPLIGAVIGTVLTLVFAAVIIVTIMRLRSNRGKRESTEGTVADKNHTLLQKETDEYVETTDSREPDVIPAIAIDPHVRSEALYKDGVLLHKQGYSKTRPEVTAHDIILVGNTMRQQGVTHAELSLPKIPTAQQGKRQDSPKEHAQIDIFKQVQPHAIQVEHEDEESHVTAETPLMETFSSKPRRATFGERNATSTSV
ncbi:protein turtle homolog A-like [Tachypleus tridentatus]|uniref:protein turtle homolog A-like n=1 Tax=Tachypleus tridentatus TaxID=6853 RepID=UPI003FD1E499